MADQASSTITIAAPPERVMATIVDFEAYPEWVGFLKRAEVVEPGLDGRAKQVRFVLDAGVIKDDYVLAYEYDGERSLSWSLVRGQVLKAQDGTYTLRPAGTGTEVTYELSVDVSMPMLGLFKRRAEKAIMDTALKELKKRVEGGG